MDDSAAIYVLRVEGALDEYWAIGFDGLSMSVSPDGTTVLAGPLVDQAALHGVLRRIRDLGLVILSVERESLEQVQQVSVRHLDVTVDARDDDCP